MISDKRTEYSEDIIQRASEYREQIMSDMRTELSYGYIGKMIADRRTELSYEDNMHMARV